MFHGKWRSLVSDLVAACSITRIKFYETMRTLLICDLVSLFTKQYRGKTTPTSIPLKHGQPTYNVTLRCVRATLVAFEKKKTKYYIFWVWVCSLSHPTRNEHAPQQFITLPEIGTIFERKNWIINHMFWFSLQLSETFLILKRNEQHMMKNVYWFSWKVYVILFWYEWSLNFLDFF
jgi:hypothetical protein